MAAVAALARTRTNRRKLFKAFHQRYEGREKQRVAQCHVDDAQRFRKFPGIGNSRRDHQDVIYARHQVKDGHAAAVRNQFHQGIELDAIRIE